MNLFEKVKNIWGDLWNYEPTEEEQRALWRVELNLLYTRVAYLEDLLGADDELFKEQDRLQLQKNILEAIQKQRELHEKRLHPPKLTPEEEADRDAWRASLTPRNKCKHLKGGRVSRWGVDKYGGAHGSVKDYNLARHRFIDFSQKIWCLNSCGFVSWKGDANWEKALEMWDQTSNQMSASESTSETLKAELR
jgi:hypothetical protein